MVVTLPLVLLLLDYWPLARLRDQWWEAVWEKLPLLGFSGAAAAITYLVQQHAGGESNVQFSCRTKVLNSKALF